MNTLAVFKILYSLLFFIEGSVSTFKSFESKTKNGGDVFNQISLIEGKTIDTWKMKQSHFGSDFKTWDNIEIRVNKLERSATYHQLNKEGEEIDLKTSCFRCHPSGPRAIRPKGSLSISNRMAILKLNMKIKSYGDLKAHKSTSKTLKVASCVKCHYKGGPRSELKEEHALTIKHLVDNKQMPPWPYSLSAKDRKMIRKFIYKF
jgi:hypothetical protein